LSPDRAGLRERAGMRPEDANGATHVPGPVSNVADRLIVTYGTARSILTYYGKPWRFRAMDRFYARFIRPNDLCFDLGSHVGNRIRSWRSLGARVVAVEPQPSCMTVLRWLYGRDPEVRLVAAAVAREPGSTRLHLNLQNPTISTASHHFMESAAGAASFQGQRWQKGLDVPATTIDALIASHGEPRFVKVDIEGFEAEALAGLTQPVFATSIEFVPMTRTVALTALSRLSELGKYWFNASYGDSMELIHPRPLHREGISEWLNALGDDGPAGDIFACLDPRPLVCSSPASCNGGTQLHV
jgi:FkbM family methyltransferase